MRKFAALAIILSSFYAYGADDISLTVDQYDGIRQRATIKVVDATQIPLGTTLRIHGKVGTCQIKIIEQVNNDLIGATEGCDNNVLTPGMNLAYSTPTWEAPREPIAQVETSYEPKEAINNILDRTSIHIGHSFARQLEGNVYSDGSVSDLRGGTALSLGIKGRVYDFNPRTSLAVELGYESPRTLDRATYRLPENENTDLTGFSPRLSLWSLSAQGEANLIDKMKAFLGMNLSFPSLRNSPFRAGTGIGFQAGANYLAWDKIAVEGLIKISNMSLRNDIGQSSNVTLAGFEVRGRYNF